MRTWWPSVSRCTSQEKPFGCVAWSRADRLHCGAYTKSDLRRPFDVLPSPLLTTSPAGQDRGHRSRSRRAMDEAAGEEPDGRGGGIPEGGPVSDPQLGSAVHPEVRDILKVTEWKTVKLPARSPDLNAHAERSVRSIREDCLSRGIPLGERHLRWAGREYVEHYHLERNHQRLGNELRRACCLRSDWEKASYLGIFTTRRVATVVPPVS